MFQKTYTFDKSNITFHDFYTEKKGFGFVNLDTVEGNTTSEKSLCAGGWSLSHAVNQSCVSFADTLENGIRTTQKRNVIVFKAIVPEYGSYEVEFSANTTEYKITDMSIFCGRRNIVKRNISVSENSSFTLHFQTYVSAYYPSMSSRIHDEKAIYISIVGDYATISKLTIKKEASTTIFVAGDSTLTDQNALTPYYPYHSCAGWAQNLLSYFDNISVCNQAHSGMTTNCFRDDGHWDIISDLIKPNDIVILQFGHNDQKRRNLSPYGGYSDNLKWYCKQIKNKHAIPIIVSPISRIPLTYNQTHYSLLSDYEKACQEVACEEQVCFINLHQLTFQKWLELDDINRDFFMPSDITHTNEYGAELIAYLFCKEIKKKELSPLYKKLKNNIEHDFNPDHDTKTVPKEPESNWLEHLAIPYRDVHGIPEYHDMVLALRNGLLDPCVMYLHPHSPMPRAQFLMVYLKALRLPGTRPYSNYFPDIKFDEWDSAFVETCLKEQLLDEETIKEKCFRPDDVLTYKDLASFLIRGLYHSTQNKISSVDFCVQEALSKNLISPADALDSFVPRAKCYQSLVKLMSLLDNASKALPQGTEIHPVS